MLQAICLVCNHVAHHKCGLCKSVNYCGESCQASDWKNHKKNCKKSSVNSAMNVLKKIAKEQFGSLVEQKDPGKTLFALVDLKVKGEYTVVSKEDVITNHWPAVNEINKVLNLGQVPKFILFTYTSKSKCVIFTMTNFTVGVITPEGLIIRDPNPDHEDHLPVEPLNLC